MEFVLQIYTGAFFSTLSVSETIKQIQTKLAQAISLINVRDVIIGWNTNATLNAAALDIIHGYGKKAWLWLPVFSEMPSPEVREPSEENFLFVCPSEPSNQELPLALYDRHFAGLGFDGVFLDKIRQSSYAAGLMAGIGCLCGRCREGYQRADVDVDAVVRRVRADPARLLPSARQGVMYRFDDPHIDRYHLAKAANITGAVTALLGAFRGRGLAVGLDVFAPLMAWYVGQDLAALSGAADFIKPMVYLRTHAPAGLPFEVAALGDIAGPDTRRVLHSAWGAEMDDATGCVRAQMMELKGAMCEIWPGFEINRVAGICDSDPAYVRAMARQYEAIGLSKTVLSWNLLSDTGENVEALAGGR